MSFTSVRKCAGGNYGESAEGSGTGWQFLQVQKYLPTVRVDQTRCTRQSECGELPELLF